MLSGILFIQGLPTAYVRCNLLRQRVNAIAGEVSPSLPPPSPSLTKEVASYEKEAVAQEQKIADMRERGQDVYVIKKQEEVLQESYMMIPDSKARLQAAVEDLEAFVVREERREEGSDVETITHCRICRKTSRC